jgi:hypothetical protein
LFSISLSVLQWSNKPIWSQSKSQSHRDTDYVCALFSICFSLYYSSIICFPLCDDTFALCYFSSFTTVYVPSSIIYIIYVYFQVSWNEICAFIIYKILQPVVANCKMHFNFYFFLPFLCGTEKKTYKKDKVIVTYHWMWINFLHFNKKL